MIESQFRSLLCPSVRKGATVPVLWTGLICLLLLFTPYLRLWGQESSVSAIVGQITDASQAAVPGAAVRVRNVDTNAERSTTSDANGNFSVPNLPPARYEITVEKSGFSTAKLQAFDLRVGETARRGITLQLGSVNQTVEVTGQAPLLQTESGTMQQVIDQRQMGIPRAGCFDPTMPPGGQCGLLVLGGTGPSGLRTPGSLVRRMHRRR